MIVGVIYPICTFLLCVLLCVSELLKVCSFRSSQRVLKDGANSEFSGALRRPRTDRNILVNFLRVVIYLA